MSLSPFPKMRSIKNKPVALSDVTLRDFSGGLQVTKNELALKNKYSTKLVNMFRDTATSNRVRYGTNRFCSCSANIINVIYFNDHLIAALANGEVQKVDDSGTVSTIWNSTIAAALPGSPSPWSGAITQIDFSEFRGDLVINNGTDKPIIVGADFTVKYLQDLATGSNINTPIAKYITTVANYAVMAGVSGSEQTIFISSTGTSGTWPNDAAPNDSTSFNVGAFTGQASSDIQGLGSFKNFLVVFFDSFSVLVQLGNFESGVHVPAVIDTYQNLGAVNHKSIFSNDSDLLFMAKSGLYSASKNVFGGTLTTEPLSENLGDLYLRTTGRTLKNEQDSFIVNDALDKTLFVFFKEEDGTFITFAMRYRQSFKDAAWSTIEGWSFTAGCTSEKGRVFLIKDDEIYQYGNSVFDNEDYRADHITDIYAGDDIVFDWEFPWLDAGNRVKSKQLKKLTLDTIGSSEFTLQCFVNNYYKDTDGEYTPAVSMDFVAGSAGGYGNNAEGFGGDEFGGGRRANDDRFFGVPVKFKIMKMRVHGSTKKELQIVSISLLFGKGNYSV